MKLKLTRAVPVLAVMVGLICVAILRVHLVTSQRTKIELVTLGYCARRAHHVQATLQEQRGMSHAMCAMGVAMKEESRFDGQVTSNITHLMLANVLGLRSPSQPLRTAGGFAQRVKQSERGEFERMHLNGSCIFRFKVGEL